MVIGGRHFVLNSQYGLIIIHKAFKFSQITMPIYLLHKLWINNKILMLNKSYYLDTRKEKWTLLEYKKGEMNTLRFYTIWAIRHRMFNCLPISQALLCSLPLWVFSPWNQHLKCTINWKQNMLAGKRCVSMDTRRRTGGLLAKHRYCFYTWQNKCISEWKRYLLLRLYSLTTLTLHKVLGRAKGIVCHWIQQVEQEDHL